MVVPDRMPAGMALARELADFMPGIEYRLQRIVGRRRQVTLVTVVPEPKVALIAGEVTGFGEAGHQRELDRFDGSSLLWLLADTAPLASIVPRELVKRGRQRDKTAIPSPLFSCRFSQP